MLCVWPCLVLLFDLTYLWVIEKLRRKLVAREDSNISISI